MTTTSPAPLPLGAARGPVRLVLRLEGLALLTTSILIYAVMLAADGVTFAALFLAPDLAFLGYLAGPRMGSIAYNATHATLGPLALAAVGVLVAPAALPAACIWLAHIGMDRALGYGLKYTSAFGDTHLGRVGRHPARAA